MLFCIGGDQRDEVSLFGTTKMIRVQGKKVSKFDFNFSKEIEPITTDYSCGDSLKNAKLFINIFINEEWDHPLIKHMY